MPHLVTDLHVDGDLKMILLLAHKRFVRVGEVETFISVHAEGWHGSGSTAESRVKQNIATGEWFLSK